MAHKFRVYVRLPHERVMAHVSGSCQLEQKLAVVCYGTYQWLVSSEFTSDCLMNES